MIKAMDIKLRAWAIWSSIREDGGSGYAQFGYRERTGGGCRGFAPGDADGVIVVGDSDGRDHVVDYEEIRTVDAQIHGRLSLSARQAFKAWYLGRGTARQRAALMGCSERTAFRRLERAQQELAALLDVSSAPIQYVNSNEGIQYCTQKAVYS
ncbi:hypothetical protein GCM10007860_09100 [Chitiniphilus shinanonensis]|uniref:Uncharacterized protein n=2 Tax=Chitiniphilus shinanonensis TaxID=553088 RepID=A0ABQ6BP21_9NEIS|nr:hypothetical protein [Chitiniphilus shinanonensis]GLS03765.1 hypothetical protein GCM10007860_09100 [Chitiniphilus shinanonensis]